MRNKVLTILFFIFLIVNVLDIVTTFYILPGEMNPIYLLTNSLLILIVFKLGVIFAVFLFYKRNTFPSHFIYYMFLLLLVLGSLITCFAVINNIYAINNPASVIDASQVSAKEKVQVYSTIVFIMYGLPMMFALLTFKLYEWSKENIIIKKQEKWWHLW
jgi:hypothetical protein